jgi:hypothetical protein
MWKIIENVNCKGSHGLKKIFLKAGAWHYLAVS